MRCTGRAAGRNGDGPIGVVGGSSGAVPVTNGAGGVTSGGARWPAWAIAYAVLIGATLLINTVNVLSLLDERVVMDRPLPWWEPAVWEATSGGVLLGLAWIPMLMVVRFSPERPGRLRSAGAHIAATVPFSLAHVGLMVALREAAYALAGEVYDFDGGTGALLYEYRKDFVSYVIFAAIFWITLRSRRRGDAVAATAAPVAAKPNAPVVAVTRAPATMYSTIAAMMVTAV